MSNKRILLSDLVAKSSIVTEIPTWVNEQSFTYFARATSKLHEDKCLFIGAEKYAKNIDYHTRMVITDANTYGFLQNKSLKCGFCIVDNPRDLFFQLMNEYEEKNGIDNNETVIGENCNIAKWTAISKRGVKIGNNVVIEEFVQIGPNVIIGDDTVIRSGAKIGIQGYNIYSYHGKSAQLFHDGHVIIGKNVLIGANTQIQQALYNYGTTVINDSTKIDGNVVIGHNAIIGAGCEITAGSCVAGYVEIGENSILRLNSTIRNGIKIGSNAEVGMGSVVVYRVRDNEMVFGNPAKSLIR